MDYICYGSPISAARDYMEDYLAESPIVYPDQSVLDKGTSYAYLSEETSRFVEGLYQSATKTVDSNSTNPTSALPAIFVITAIGSVGLLLILTKKRKR
jgi:spermidine/putrescine-binding protein